MEPYYILSLSEDSHDLREKVALTDGVDPLWRANIFSQLVINIRGNESEIVDDLEGLDGIEHVVQERIGEQNSTKFNDKTASVMVEPSFGEEEHREFIEEEFSGVKHTHKSSIFEDIVVEEYDDLRIGVIDSGIDTRNPQITNVVKRINFTDNDKLDAVGHGTLVAGNINVQFPNIEIVDLKVLGDGTIRESTVIQALAEALDPVHNITSINISLGFEPRDGYCPLCEAVTKADYCCMPIVASSGQLAKPSSEDVPPMCPARADNALAVTADSGMKTNDWFAQGDVQGKSDFDLTFNED